MPRRNGRPSEGASGAFVKRPCASSAPVQPTPPPAGPARFPPVRLVFRRHNPTPAAPAAFAWPPGCSRRSGVKAWRPGSRGLLRVRLRPARPTRPSPGTVPSGSAPSLQRHSPSPPGLRAHSLAKKRPASRPAFGGCAPVGPAGSRCPSLSCPLRPQSRLVVPDFACVPFAQ